MTFYQPSPWHEGEDKVHELTSVPYTDNPNSPFLLPRAAYLIQRFPLISLGTLDDQDRPWATLWGGEPPFALPVAQSIIGIRTTVDASYDPVLEALYKGKDDGEVVREDGPGRMISGLSISLEERNRVKLYGRMVAGALNAQEGESSEGRPGQVQLVIKIEQSLLNCPKYLNKKIITPALPEPNLLSSSPHLSPEAINLISQADLFFVASAHAHEDMDCNHRGGPPGFVQVSQPQSPTEPTVLVWPEYSGNNLYQTLGNLMATPRAGLVIPNFETGDVLYITGNTEVLVGREASSIISKSTLAVRLTITASRHVQRGLAFRGINVNDATQGRSPI